MVKKEKTVEQKVVLNTLKKELTDDQFRTARKEVLSNAGAVPTTELEDQQIINSKKHDREKLVMDLAIASVYLNWVKQEIKCVEKSIKWFESREGILADDLIVRNNEGISVDKNYFIYMYHHKIIYFKKLVAQYKWDLDSARESYNIVPAEVDLKIQDMLMPKESSENEQSPSA